MKGNNEMMYVPYFIIESDEWFTIKSLILHSEGSRPTFQAIGKIASVREIRLVDSTEATEAPGFFMAAFSGGAWVQAVRLVGYFVGLILIIVPVVVPFAGLSSFFAKRRRRKRAVQFKLLTKRTLNEKDEYIFERYVEEDIHYLARLKRALTDEERLNQEAKRCQRAQKKIRQGHKPAEIVINREYVYSASFMVEDMMKSGFLFEENGRWNVNSEQRATLNEFIQFLRIKGIDYPEFRGGTLDGAEQCASAEVKQNVRS